MDRLTEILSELSKIIATRKEIGDIHNSYVAKLFAKGHAKIAQKVGEEGVEIAIAAANKNKNETIKESADMLFHLLILWEEMNISADDIAAELERRKGTSGIAEKAARK